ncbi:MAG: hypothetical protein KatS3mg087_0248 [Patescibacteria group bacterium]|nr:MAG: hypothetical protein KatS3mg087_0248 [Patescibacteria group bacterium]
MSTAAIEQMGEKLRTARVGRLGLLLYFATLLAELPGVLARYLVVSGLYGLLWLLTQVVVALSLLSQGGKYLIF